MRFQIAQKGEKRDVEGFLWLPRGFDGNEIRWLEHAKWREYYDGINWIFYYWND